MDIGAGLYMHDVVVKKFTFTISSSDEFLSMTSSICCASYVFPCFVRLCRSTYTVGRVLI